MGAKEGVKRNRGCKVRCAKQAAPPTLKAHNAVVSALGRAGAWRRALDVVARLRAAGLRPAELVRNFNRSGRTLCGCAI